MGISAVEKDTGLSKDSLRTWERRYGFPQPVRDAKGERRYPGDQVEKLRLLRRLMDRGTQPGSIVTKSFGDLVKLASERKTATGPPSRFNEEVDTLVRLVKARNIADLKARLHWQLSRLGVHQFVMQLVPGLNDAIGTAWSQGDVSVAEEHLYGEQIEAVLRSAIAGIAMAPAAPKVLLTTFPGEQHKIGLLMLEAVLAIELVECMPLGTQTPVSEIARFAIAGQVDIVALSFSNGFARRMALGGLGELRVLLPRKISIWAGGDGVKGIRKKPDGIVMPMTLASAVSELRKWRN